MKLSTLELAIANAIIDPIGVNSTDDFHNLLKARDEIIALANQCDDGLDTDVTITSWYAFSNLMNTATYDDFGRIRKSFQQNHRAQTRQYRNVVRNICEEFTDAQIDGVADFLSDLWYDNEADGAHNPDGSFNKGDISATAEARIKELGDIINKLYHHRGLSADDLSTIQLFIH